MARKCGHATKLTAPCSRARGASGSTSPRHANPAQAQFMPPSAYMLLSPQYIPQLAAIVGLFTRYGLRDVAQKQGLLALVDGGEAELPAEEAAERNERARCVRKRLVELG